MLPHPLSLLLTTLSLLPTPTHARTPLSLDDITSLNTLSLPSPPSFSIPPQGPSGPPLSITIALCSSAAPAPRFFVGNVSADEGQGDPGPGGAGGGVGVGVTGRDSREVVLQGGFGNWTGLFPQGGILAVDVNGATGVQFDVGVSDGDPKHEVLDALPLLGDTTANQAILFSAPFSPLPPLQAPTYPNYTLPPASSALGSVSPPPLPPLANSSSPSTPSTPNTNANVSLLITPTSQAPTTPLLNSACFLSTKAPTGHIANTSLWARDRQGWRIQWLVEGLTPGTNYTAFVLNGTKVSGPVYFATKSAAFACPLVHSLPFCPGVAYAVPLPPPPASVTSTSNKGTYDASSLPQNLTQGVQSYLANFTTVLTTFACGRDWYSPLVGCDDCQRAYRAWLCATTFVRCSEPSPSNPNGFTSVPPEPSATGIFASLTGSGSSPNQQQPLSALLPQPTTAPPRSPLLPPLSTTYTQLLPCIEQCQATDRACPPFIGFQCPKKRFNAGASYGVGYIDGPSGEMGKGLTGGAGAGAGAGAQDRWGNVWCNYVEEV